MIYVYIYQIDSSLGLRLWQLSVPRLPRPLMNPIGRAYDAISPPIPPRVYTFVAVSLSCYISYLCRFSFMVWWEYIHKALATPLLVVRVLPGQSSTVRLRLWLRVAVSARALSMHLPLGLHVELRHVCANRIVF
jgi:hypothetical protein